MGLSGRRILAASYGGGHAALMTPVAQAVQAAGATLDLIGLTTAFAHFRRAGLPARDVSALVLAEDAPFAQAVAPYLPDARHPDVSAEATLAYFTLGYRSLVAEVGEVAARAAVAARGRLAFEPVWALRRYLERTQPDLVVTTTSPRFEHALVRACGQLGVPCVAIGDHFLVLERARFALPDHQADLAVLTAPLAAQLVAEGLAEARVHATGNPAFDALRGASDATPEGRARRVEVRARLGVAGKTVILWPGAGGETNLEGLRFTTLAEGVRAMEAVCARAPGHVYLLRPHPNCPPQDLPPMPHGVLDWQRTTPEEALLAADIVCVEASTMGLQAGLLGKPVICVGFADLVAYPHYGLARSVETLEAAVEALVAGDYAPPAPEACPPLGGATARVMDLIARRVAGA